MNAEQVNKAVEYNRGEQADGDFTDDQIVRLVQFFQEHHHLEDDGWCGPLTQQTIDTSMKAEWAPPAPAPIDLGDESQFVDGKWLAWDGPESSQPKNYYEARLSHYFDNPETSPGSDKLDKRWFKRKIIELHGDDRLPGVPARWYVKIHRMVEPYLREGLRRAQLSAPDYHVLRLGGFVFRHIRNDPSKPLSMHAFGCAFDIDADVNYARTFKRGETPEAWSEEYYKIWPDGVPEAWVQAMASVGFTWGNDWDEDGSTADHRWLDPMHFEWIARDGNQFDV